MYDILNKYLFQHRSISIPGLGSLVAENIPAVADFANKQLLPVQVKFRFDKYYDVPDKSLFSYLSAVKNMPDFEAMAWFSDFAASLRARIKKEEEAVWQDVGTFRKDFGGEIVFEPFSPSYELYPAVPAERIIRADATHSILVGDKEKTNYEMTELLNDESYVEKESWWIYALILAAVGLSVLFFYFYSNHMKWTTGNQQKPTIVQPAPSN